MRSNGETVLPTPAQVGAVALALVVVAAPVLAGVVVYSGTAAASHEQSEPNDTFAEADKISGGSFADTELGTASEITGNVNDNKDYDFDWFKFNVDSSNNEIHLELTNDISEDGDIAVKLYDPSGNLVKTEQTETDDETLTYTVTDSNKYGDWRVKVYAADDPKNNNGQAAEDCDSGAGCDGTYSGTFSFPPTADATVGSTTVLEGADVSFDGTGTTDPDDSLSELTFDWDFGDATGSGSAPTHRFSTTNDGGTETFAPSLTVTDSGGGSSSDTTQSVTVYSDYDGDGVADTDADVAGIATGDTDDDNDGVPDVDDPEPYSTPFADASASESRGLVRRSVQFDGTATGDDGSITSYEWDWDGDGTYEATGATPTHTFEESGTKTVTLRVTDNEENTDTDTLTVDIRIPSSNDPPTVRGAADSRTIAPGETTTLRVTEASDPDGDAMTFSWQPASIEPDSYQSGAGRTIQVTGHETRGSSQVIYYLHATDEEGNEDRYTVQLRVKPSTADETGPETGSGNATNATDAANATNATDAANATNATDAANATNATDAGTDSTGSKAGEGDGISKYVDETDGDGDGDSDVTRAWFEQTHPNLDWEIWKNVVSDG